MSVVRRPAANDEYLRPTWMTVLFWLRYARLSAAGDALDDDVAYFQTARFGFPKAEIVLPAIDAMTEPGGDVGERLAHFFGKGFALPQDDMPAGRGKIGHVFGRMCTVRGAGEQEAGKAGRVNDHVRACLMRDRFVVL
jgi:hypothetical protein